MEFIGYRCKTAKAQYRCAQTWSWKGSSQLCGCRKVWSKPGNGELRLSQLDVERSIEQGQSLYVTTLCNQLGNVAMKFQWTKRKLFFKTVPHFPHLKRRIFVVSWIQWFHHSPALQRSTSCKTSSPFGPTVPTKAKEMPTKVAGYRLMIHHHHHIYHQHDSSFSKGKQGINGDAPFINGTNKWKSHPFKTSTMPDGLAWRCLKDIWFTNLAKLCKSPESGIFREFTYQTESATSASGLPSCIGWAHQRVPKWTYSLLSLLTSASFQFGLSKT